MSSHEKKRKMSAPSTAATSKKKKKKKGRTVKELNETELLDGAMKAFRWWELPEPKQVTLPDGTTCVPNWTSMEHNGVCFPPEHERLYDKSGNMIRMRYEGAPVDLTLPEDEVAHFYAKALTCQQLQDPKTAKIFNTNFMKGFKRVLGSKHVVKDFRKCNFQPIKDRLDEIRDEKKSKTKEEKDFLKEKRAIQQRTYGYALVDNKVQKVGNIVIEPPSLFRGRGTHPKMGTIKRRSFPEDVIVNCSRDGVVPKCSIPGHNWASVVHRPEVTWLAMWKENVNGNVKYVYLANSSMFKGKSDRDKYEKARKLKKYIGKIRKDYTKNLRSQKKHNRQRATAMWIIDVLALRVGGEKNTDEEADTVGCCSLRVEHFDFGSDESEDEKYTLTLDFLGKDSMRYLETIDFNKYGDIGRRVYNNLQGFCKRKKPQEEVFDTLSPSILNKHLQELMPGLTAKVFRTYNASVTLEKQLPPSIDHNMSRAEQVLVYNAANREVSILCNHQRSVPKSFEASFAKLTTKLNLKKRQLKELRKHLKLVRDSQRVPVAKESYKDKEAKAKDAHLFKRQPSEDQLKKRIAKYKITIKTQELNIKTKDDNKAVSLTTAKINYMDPRVSVAWCKRNEVPIERVFSRTLQDKFPWAMSAAPDWKF
eukprot:g266.t1